MSTAPLETTVERLVREVMPRRLQQAPVEPSMSLRGELGIDSLGLMSLAFRLEEEFCIDLMGHADEVANVQTVGDVHRLVHLLGSSADP